MKSKIKKNLFYLIFGLLLVTSVTLSILSIVKAVKNSKSTINKINNWDNVPEKFKEFSKKNSLKISFQISENEYNKNYFSSEGTAWSWYYEQVENFEYKYEWYLMTNFHVINEAIAFVNNLTIYNNENSSVDIKDTNQLKEYYRNNWLTKYWEENNNDLNNIFNIYMWNGNKYNSLISPSSSFVESINIITDFNNENLTLFSKGDIYNLDMALVKINLDFSKNYSLLNSNYQCDNIWLKYLNNNSLLEYPIDNKYIYISGNPYEYHQLVGVLLNEQKWKKEYQNLTISNNEILSLLKAPYFYSTIYYSNFLLSNGASGSPVYQIDNKDIELSQIIPIGIYWGGQENSKSLFSPSFIPFKYNNVYNVFENFKNEKTKF